MRISLAEHGLAFSTRPRGAALRQLVLDEARGFGTVEIDFRGVRSVSYSFADEFVGELMQRRMAGRCEFDLVLVNVALPLRRVIVRSLHNRGVAADSATLFGALTRH